MTVLCSCCTLVHRRCTVVRGRRTAIHGRCTAVHEPRTAIHGRCTAVHGRCTAVHRDGTAVHWRGVRVHALQRQELRCRERTNRAEDDLCRPISSSDATVSLKRKWRSFWRTSDPSRPRWDCPPTGKRNCKRATTVGVRGQTSHAQRWRDKGCAGTIPPR